MEKINKGIMALFILGISMTYGQEKIKLNHDHSKMEMKQVAIEFGDDNVASAYEHYQHIKNDLVGSNSEDAQKGALMLNEALKKIEGSEVALEASSSIAATDNLKAQRKAFSELSNAMEKIVKGKLKSGKIYKAFCPMALNGGAYWLSSIEAIRNPYYGAQMLSCGKVKEVIQ
ncbi:DUF3347 domain-containing protein [Flagellimonas pacifica]|uniref:DUF3347 domain-containing protein n=1 Tax=Flagellimonas pacifica TaxID=1247520 RepID=A0A285MVV8_9FLAO|nr:DUF3347 domain-containing protein [Allomuricauda parva]SNZ01324.1 Protein of unknown function [Allomuricauda parva]